MSVTGKKKLNGRLFISLAGIIGITMIMLNLIETTIVVENTKMKIRTLNTDHYIDITRNYAERIKKNLEEYITGLDYYLNADVLETKDTEQIVEWLRAHENKRKEIFDYVAWVDKNGDFYSDIGSKTNVLDRDYYQAIIEKGEEVYIDNPVTSKTTGKTIVHICKAAKVNGETIGFFCAVVDSSHLYRFLEGINVGKDGIAVLFSGDGNVIAKNGIQELMTVDFTPDTITSSQRKVNSTLQNENSNEVAWNMIDGIGEVLTIQSRIGLTHWVLVIFIRQYSIVQIAQQIANYLIFFSVLLAACVVLIGAFTVYKAIKPLKVVENTILDIATGNADLTRRIEVTSKNEIGRVTDGFNQFTEKLHIIMSTMKATKDQLINAGRNLDSCTQDTASAITEIIANIESMNANIQNQGYSVDQTSGAVNQIASNIESLNQMIESQTAAVEEASASIEEMIGNINSVNNSVLKMAADFDELQKNAIEGMAKQDDVSAKIQIIESESEALQEANTVIANIAEQTNLLAMNAAIEAAHAGETGKGFSVVADEIRKLSETSSSESETIGNQLAAIIQNIKSMVEASNNAHESFVSVAQGIEKTNMLVQEINGSMQEQMEGSKQISNALNAMNNSSAEVKTASEEMAEGNKSILLEIQKLQDATINMRSGMDEMSVGATQINRTGSDLSEIAHKMEEAISNIGDQVDLFRV
ncbi:MAG: methyl-accepting chemotaxis protein [Treponema sp.]|nr:methyl-accepting chemotaxis protein [Treponema sp.]